MPLADDRGVSGVVVFRCGDEVLEPLGHAGPGGGSAGRAVAVFGVYDARRRCRRLGEATISLQRQIE
jgi:hypothetical protein